MLKMLKRTQNSHKPYAKDQLLQLHPMHEWIREEARYFNFFKDLLFSIEDSVYAKLTQECQLCFLYSNGLYASTLPGKENQQFILIYPELARIIHSVDNSYAFAIILHELGHIYYNHAQDHNKSALQKQLEADRFVFDHHFGEELFNFLLDQKRSFEVVERIKSLESMLLKDQ